MFIYLCFNRCKGLCNSLLSLYKNNKSLTAFFKRSMLFTLMLVTCVLSSSFVLATEPQAQAYNITPASMIRRVSKVQGNCPFPQRLLTVKEAKDLMQPICDEVSGGWTIAYLANDSIFLGYHYLHGYLFGSGLDKCNVTDINDPDFSRANISESLCFDSVTLRLNRLTEAFDNHVNAYFYVPKQPSVIEAEASDDNQFLSGETPTCSKIVMNVVNEQGIKSRLTLCAARYQGGVDGKMNDGFIRPVSPGNSWQQQPRLIVSYRPEDNLNVTSGRYSNPEGLLIHAMDYELQPNGIDAALLDVIHIDIGHIDVKKSLPDRHLMTEDFEISQALSSELRYCLFLADSNLPTQPRMHFCDNTNELSHWFYSSTGQLYAYRNGEGYCLRIDSRAYLMQYHHSAPECAFWDGSGGYDFIQARQGTFHFVNDEQGTKTLMEGKSNDDLSRVISAYGESYGNGPLNNLTLNEFDNPLDTTRY